jgi:hypothetical protein
MNQTVIRRWVEALRSGDYRQGQDRLEVVSSDSDDAAQSSFCCLGVLCDLAVQDGIIGRRVRHLEGDVTVYFGDDNDRDQYYLPKKVVEWAGLEDLIGSGSDDPRDVFVHGIGLTARNDCGESFEQIANAVEELL